MNEILLITIISIVVAMLTVLVWLVFENRKLKQRFNILSSYVERNNKDIAGLCSAAISVDSKLSDSSVKLNDIAEKVTDIKQHDQQASQPYQNEIQRVRDGANAEELINQCGLSRDEAVLLIRLHGQSQ
jgi:CII-binding regulator of phage lambda lysogenization HflD